MRSAPPVRPFSSAEDSEEEAEERELGEDTDDGEEEGEVHRHQQQQQQQLKKKEAEGKSHPVAENRSPPPPQKTSTPPEKTTPSLPKPRSRIYDDDDDDDEDDNHEPSTSSKSDGNRHVNERPLAAGARQRVSEVSDDESGEVGGDGEGAIAFEALPPAYGPKASLRAPTEPIRKLEYEVFVRFGTTMPRWAEDSRSIVVPPDGSARPARRNHNQRPLFPAQLLSAPRADTPLARHMRFTPQEDAAMLIWMIRAFTLFGDEKGFGLTSFQSPCLWHWAEQHRLTLRGWESMKSRARIVLCHYIHGTSPLPEDVFECLRDNDYFTFDGTRLAGFDRRRVEADNEASFNAPQSQQNLAKLPPPPPAVPQKLKKAHADRPRMPPILPVSITIDDNDDGDNIAPSEDHYAPLTQLNGHDAHSSDMENLIAGGRGGGMEPPTKRRKVSETMDV